MSGVRIRVAAGRYCRIEGAVHVVEIDDLSGGCVCSLSVRLCTEAERHDCELLNPKTLGLS